MNSAQQEQFITQTVTSLMEEAGFQSLDDKSRRQHEQITREQLLLSLGMAVIEALPEGQRLEYVERFLETGDQHTVDAKEFIRTHVHDIQQVFEQGVEEFKRQYLEAVR